MLRWWERFLWLVAATAILVYAGSWGERSVSQVYLNWKFDNELNLPKPARPASFVIPETVQMFGRLEIPSINLSQIFVEGADASTLRRAVGHIPGTASPGGAGNVVLAAHRDTFFRRLGNIRDGDVIRLITVKGSYEYVVESSLIVDPDERIALRDLDRPTLTLVTCYPFHYVGSAPKRFVVHASLVTESR